MPSEPTTGKSSFFTACDAGKCLVPRPAMGMTALRIFIGVCLDVEPLPALCAEIIIARAELDCAGGGAFKNVRHHADAAGVFDGDFRNVFFERFLFAEHGHRAARSAAGDLGAIQSDFDAA